MNTGPLTCVCHVGRVCWADVGADGKSQWARRFGLFGDLPTRVVQHAVRVVPWFLDPVLIGSWTVLFFILAGKQRRAVAGNLRALHPAWGTFRATLGAWRVFWNFALTWVDGLRCDSQTGGVDWVVDGVAVFDEIAARKDGCIILTAHMGNYDIAAPMFTGKFGRTLYTVRAPEREPEMQAIREEELRRKEEAQPLFRTLYNREGSLLGVELARLLNEGNLVAVQGDRVIFDVSPMSVEVEPGLRMRLPKGPLFLARATGAPCFPLFIVRDGWRRYRVMVFPELILPPRKRGADDEAAKVWAAAILEVVRRHWMQWFVFEPLLERLPENAGDT